MSANTTGPTRLQMEVKMLEWMISPTAEQMECLEDVSKPICQNFFSKYNFQNVINDVISEIHWSLLFPQT